MAGGENRCSREVTKQLGNNPAISRDERRSNKIAKPIRQEKGTKMLQEKERINRKKSSKWDTTATSKVTLP